MERRIHERMKRQHGLVTRRQAREEGMTDTQIKWRVRTGDWVRISHGVYRHRSAPDTRIGRLLAACLRCDALASHRAAAALHGIDGFRLDRIELVVPRGGARSMRGAIVHQSNQFDLAKRVDCMGVPCTGLGRTLLDVSAVVSRQRLDQAIDSVLRDGRLRLTDLYRVLVSHARRGRDGCAAFRASLEDRCDGLVPLSAWSRLVADLLVESGLGQPVMEYRIHSPDGGFIAQVDLAYPDYRVAIELDSRRWHLNRVSFDKDPERRNRLTVLGWTVLNFTWTHYAQGPGAMCATVKAACRQSRP
ncbi:MAG: type IV toxin-antitoxin system AbiEi family antitoxin domain-containing protein [Acidimicrobiaceae bacterium]|nr:type IV toxin-antitoxin system AbiEi family antitoxin domain-containing protein [Acidimicrobiaceae bacterium]